MTDDLEKTLPPRLLGVARGELAAFAAASDVLRESSGKARELHEIELASFARDTRALLGHERLPDPVLAWATLSPSGDAGLRRALPGGMLEMRRWEGRFTFFRRGREGAGSALAKLLGDARILGTGEPTRRARVRLSGAPGEPAALHELLEWQGELASGRFASFLVLFAGKSLLFALRPLLERAPWERSHESAHENAVAAAAARKRPPSARALRSPLFMPRGGRFSRPPRRRPPPP